MHAGTAYKYMADSPWLLWNTPLANFRLVDCVLDTLLNFFSPLRLPHISGTAWMYIGSALRHEEQLSYCQQASQNLLPLSKWTEILSKSYVEQRDLGWKLDECFILFAHISLAPLWNSAIFFIVSLHNDQHLLVLIALVNTWHRLILSCVLAHCETWKSNKFQLLWGFHTRGSQSTLSESFMQWADGDAIHLLLAQSRFPPAT